MLNCDETALDVYRRLFGRSFTTVCLDRKNNRPEVRLVSADRLYIVAFEATTAATACRSASMIAFVLMSSFCLSI